MSFSGTINWGGVVAEIVISDVNIEDGSITKGKVVFTMNGETAVYNLGVM